MKTPHQYPEFREGFDAALTIARGFVTQEAALAKLITVSEWLSRDQHDVCVCRRPRHEHSMVPPHECDDDSGSTICDGFRELRDFTK